MKRIVTAFFIFSMLLSISCESQEKAYEYTGNDSIKSQMINRIKEMGVTIVKEDKNSNDMQISEKVIDLFVEIEKQWNTTAKDSIIVVPMISEESLIHE